MWEAGAYLWLTNWSVKSSVSVGVVSDLAFSIDVLPLGVTIFSFYSERKSKFSNTEEYGNYCCVNFSERANW